jgi:hypothetical protein
MGLTDEQIRAIKAKWKATSLGTYQTAEQTKKRLSERALKMWETRSRKMPESQKWKIGKARRYVQSLWKVGKPSLLKELGQPNRNAMRWLVDNGYVKMEMVYVGAGRSGLYRLTAKGVDKAVQLFGK